MIRIIFGSILVAPVIIIYALNALSPEGRAMLSSPVTWLVVGILLAPGIVLILWGKGIMHWNRPARSERDNKEAKNA